MQFEKDMNSTYKELFLATREFLLTFDDVSETKKERITTYGNQHGGICHMRTTKKGVDVGFLKGAQIPDKFGLLTGNTKKMRVYSMTKLDKEILGYYMQESIKLNDG